MNDDKATHKGQLLTLTPSRLDSNGQNNEKESDYTNRLKRFRKDQSGDDTNYIEILQQQLSEEKHNSKILRAQLSEMREQITKLSDTIAELNKTISKLHKSEADKHSRKIKKKSPNKSSNNNATAKPTQSAPNNHHSNTHTPLQNIVPNTSEKMEIGSVSEPQNVNDSSSGSGNNSSSDTLNNSITLMSDKSKNIAKHTSEKNDDDDDVDDENNSVLSISDDETDKKQIETETNGFTVNEKVQRSSKIPPIVIWTENQQATQQIIRHNMPNYSCIFTRVKKSKMRVLPKTVEVRNKLIDLLRKRNIDYNTYTPSDERMQSLLLKGTEIEDAQEIIDTLNDHGIVPHNVQLYETGYMRKNNIKSNIWQITLQPKTDTNTLTNIRYIAEWSVKWELQRKRTLIQCRRCQRFQHLRIELHAPVPMC